MAHPGAEETRERILDAAEQVFLEGGFAGASMSAIARAAGVNQSLISHHFGSKRGVWEAAYTRLQQRFFDEQRRMLDSAPDGPDVLRTGIANWFRFLAANPEAARLEAWMFLSDVRPSFEAGRELLDRGFERLEQGQAAGAIRDDVPAPFLWAAFMGMGIGWSQLRARFADVLEGAAGDRDLDEAFLDAALAVLLRGFAPP